MASPGSPAAMRAHIIERLVGETGEPDRVTDAARALAEKALPAIVQGLGDTLALTVAVELKTVELSRFAAARPSGESHAMTVVSSPSAPDALVLTMDPAAMAVIITALFGGDPDIAVAPIERGLSPTEVEVATLVFEEIVKALNGSGDGAFAFTRPLATTITGPDLKKHVIRDGPGVRAVFAVSTQAGSGKIALTISQRLLNRGGKGAAQAGSGQSAQWSRRFNEEVMRSTIDLQATMPLARMTLGQLAGLHEGQVIEIEGEAQSQARLSVRQKTLFVCEFGKLGQNYTVRIRHPFDAGQDFMDGLLTG